MNADSSRSDGHFKILMLETLSVFGRLNENFINLIVTIFHCFGEVDAGRIGLSQGDPYSLEWEVVMLELAQEDWVGIEQRGYREYFLKKEYTQTENFKEVLEKLKHKSFYEMRELALNCHYRIENNNQQIKSGINELKNLLNMERIDPSTT